MLHPPHPPDSGDAPPALSLVMPLFNEAAGVRDVVRSLEQTLRDAGLRYQLILVDNGSRDTTGECLLELAAESPSIELVTLPENAGYGGGILAGLRFARAPVVGYLWGDEQIDHHAVVAAYRHLTHAGLDLCKVRRVIRLDGWQRYVVTRTYHAVFPLFFSRVSSDVHGCPKLFTRAALELIRPSARDWFLDAEIMLRARALQLKAGEIDVVAWPRRTGRSKVRFRTLAEFAVNMARYGVLFKIRPSGSTGQGFGPLEGLHGRERGDTR